MDERLAAYGFETNTGVKFVAVVDMRGRVAGGGGGGGGGGAGSAGIIRGGVGLRETELRVVFRAMQTAYVRLLQNPFYDPDEHAPLVLPPGAAWGGRGLRAVSLPRR